MPNTTVRYKSVPGSTCLTVSVPCNRTTNNLPRQIRRARGALARAKPLEDRALRHLHYWYPTTNITYATALSVSLRDRANDELARAVCHALQYLFSPPTEAEIIAKGLDHIAANGVP